MLSRPIRNGLSPTHFIFLQEKSVSKTRLYPNDFFPGTDFVYVIIIEVKYLVLITASRVRLNCWANFQL